MKSRNTSKRRQFSKEQKCAILAEYFERKSSMVSIAREHGIHAVTLANWKREMSDKDPKMNHSKADLIAEVEKQKEENKRLKKIVGDLSLDKEILQEAIEIFKKNPKNPKSR
ncbi:MAG: transposase [Bacteriovoracaceae bacterium]|nr:transposase [Bacteriovoracaceae bacterium]